MASRSGEEAPKKGMSESLPKEIKDKVKCNGSTFVGVPAPFMGWNPKSPDSQESAVSWDFPELSEASVSQPKRANGLRAS